MTVLTMFFSDISDCELHRNRLLCVEQSLNEMIYIDRYELVHFSANTS